MAASLLLKNAPAQLERAEAIPRQGRLLLLDTLTQAWRRCVDGETHSLQQKADLLLAMAHAMRSAVQAVDLACRIAQEQQRSELPARWNVASGMSRR